MKFSEFNEIEQRGTLSFPVSYYYLTHTNPRYIMVPHWHKDFEIIRVISGEFKLYLNNIPYSLHSGDIIFVPCGMLHRGESNTCVYECIVLDLNFLRRKSNDIISTYITPIINGSSVINCVLNKNDDLIYSTANSIFSIMHSKESFFELDVCSQLLKMFSLLYKCNYIHTVKENKTSMKQTQNIIKMLDWIEENLTEPFSLEKLSEISGLNSKYICRIFKEYTSKTPVTYLNEKRIEIACHEIAVNGSSITKAAYDCGFNDLIYFSKVFKAYKGISPKDFKKTITSK